MTATSPLFLLYAISGLLAVAIFHQWTSRINQYFFFSRSAPSGFDGAGPGRKITNAYRAHVWLAFAAALAVFAILIQFTHLSLKSCFLASVVIEWIGSCAAFARAHALAGTAIAQSVADGPLTIAIPDPQPVSVSLTSAGTFTPRLIRMLLFAPAFAAAAWLVPMLALKMDFPRFSSAIEANKADFILGLGCGMLAASLLLFVQLRYFSRHRTPLARFTARGCVEMAWIGAIAIALSTFSAWFHLVITVPIRRSIMAVVLLYALLRIVYTWTRKNFFPPSPVERNGDQHWLWGLFYYNPGDPTLFIQSRSGPGYTLNFANFLSWPLALFVLADLVFLAVIHVHG